MSNRSIRVGTYLVRGGDTLSEISIHSRTAVDVIKRLNPQLDGEMQNGDFVTLPSSALRLNLHAALSEAAATTFGAVPGDPSVLQIAYREFGQAASPGPANNNRVIEYLHSVESLNPSLANSDETDWCSCFVNWCVEQSGQRGTDKATAQSWKSWGVDITASPRRGSIAVFQRWKDDEAPSWKGHVGFLLAETATSITVLGGNQGRSVSRRDFPRNGKLGSTNYRLLSIRSN